MRFASLFDKGRKDQELQDEFPRKRRKSAASEQPDTYVSRPL
jgi:hypothetical protein